MSKYKHASKCCKKHYISSGVRNLDSDHCGPCRDVCVNALCGEPDVLSLFVPVIYDEVGFNACVTIPMVELYGLTNADTMTAQVIDMDFNYYTGPVPTVKRLSGRPNCYEVSLTNLDTEIYFNIYDSSKKFLADASKHALLLPADEKDPAFDAETNPSSVELEIYAPYGLGYTGTVFQNPELHYIGFNAINNLYKQGLNVVAIPKVLDINTTDLEVTVGFSIYLHSVYFSKYNFHHEGKTHAPKACLLPVDDSVCRDFVNGRLLEYSIKPLELGPPKREEFLKDECTDDADALSCDDDLPKPPCFKDDEI